MKKIILSLVFLFLIIPFTFTKAHALSTHVSPNDNGDISIDQNIDDSLAVAGNNIVINGNIKDNLYVAGSNIIINGSVGGSVIGGGSTVSINGSVGEDVIFAGNVINISQKSQIQRDLYLAAANININGEIKNNAKLACSSLNINGKIGNNVQTASDSITISNSSSIAGSFKYYRNNQISFNQTPIKGDIIFEKIQDSTSTPYKYNYNYNNYFNFKAFQFIFGILQAVLLAVVLILIAPNWISNVAENAQNKTLNSLGIGFLLLISVPIGLILIAMTILGLPIAFLFGIIYIVFLVIAKVIVGYYIGLMFAKKTWSKPLTVTLGVLFLEVLFFIPIIGFFARLVVSSLALGAIYYNIFSPKK